MAAHAYEEQPGEVRIQLDGATIAELFDEAARALAELIGIGAEYPPGPWQQVVVDAQDDRTLFVSWINELIERSEVDHLVYAEVEIDELTSRRIRARIRGVPISETRTRVKTATMHGLLLGTGPDAISASVVVEV